MRVAAVYLLLWVQVGAVRTSHAPLTLHRARELAASALAHGGQIGPIRLARYNSHSEIEIGKGIRVLVISAQDGGGLLVFDPAGQFIAAKQTNEVTGIQLFDFDRDGVMEVICDEVVARGTGVLIKKFRIYRWASSEVKQLWEGESFFSSAPMNAQPERRFGFIRYDDAFGEVTLRHVIVRDSAATQEAHTYRLQDGAFRRMHSPKGHPR